MKPRLAAILALVLAALTVAAAVYSVVANFPRGLILAVLLIGAAIAGWYGLLRTGLPRVVGLVAAAALALAAVLIVILDSGVLELVLIGATALGDLRRDQGRLLRPRAAPGRRRPGPPGALLQPEVRRRQGGAVQARRRGSGARDRADRADPPATSSSSCATRSPAAPTRWRWPAATARRRSSPRSPPSATSPTPASRPGPATTSRSTSGSIATMSSARSTPSSTAARTRRPRRGQRPRVRQQRLARPLRRGRPARRLSRGEAQNDPRHAARRAGAGGRGARPALDRARRQRALRRARRSSSPTTATGSAGRSARAPGRRSTTACSGSRSPARRPGAASDRRVPQRPWREWSAPEFEVRADGPIAAGIDGEALVLEAPLRFSIRPGVLRVRIARAHPGASPSTAMPESMLGTARAVLAIAAGRHRP